MPSTYAHERFGKKVLETLPDALRADILEEKDLYYIGVQGPDIFFYYNPLTNNEIGKVGTACHEMSGRVFFDPRIQHLMTLSGERETAAHSYLAGCLTHFVLDATCHGYICGYTERTGTSHAAIEGDFDRALLEADGYNPVKHNLCRRFVPTHRAAHIIAGFYPDVNPMQVYKSLEGFKKNHRLLYCPNDAKRNVLYGAMKVIGKYDELSGHIISPKANPACAESTARLMRFFDEAIPWANEAICHMEDMLAGDFSSDITMMDLFSRNFDGSQP